MGEIIKSHIWEGAEQCVSPNHDERPNPEDICLLVIHNISLPPNDFGSDDIIQFFTNQLDCSKHPFYEEIKDLKVSSHILIRRDGSVVQFVPFHKRAWHAGESTFQGRTQCNDFSIGIELEGTDDTPYTDKQYEKLIQVSKEIMKTYPKISKNNIQGHSDIAPYRKTDPGPSFDWDRYLKGLA